MAKPDLSEQSFFGAALIVLSAVGSIVGVGAFFWKDAVVLLALAAGSAWALSISLLVMNSVYRRRIAQLETAVDELKTELDTEKGRVGDLSATARSVSTAVLSALRLSPEAELPPPRQRGKPKK